MASASGGHGRWRPGRREREHAAVLANRCADHYPPTRSRSHLLGSFAAKIGLKRFSANRRVGQWPKTVVASVRRDRQAIGATVVYERRGIKSAGGRVAHAGNLGQLKQADTGSAARPTLATAAAMSRYPAAARAAAAAVRSSCAGNSVAHHTRPAARSCRKARRRSDRGMVRRIVRR